MKFFSISWDEKTGKLNLQADKTMTMLQIIAILENFSSTVLMQLAKDEIKITRKEIQIVNEHKNKTEK
jgi:hypothetical protein